MNLLKVLSAVVILVVILVILQFTVGLSIFNEIFSTFGFSVEGAAALQWLILAILVVAVLVLGIGYFSIMNVKYEFYDDKLTYYRSVMLIFKSSTDISYQNISRVTYENQGFFDGLFNTGTVILDLSSLGEKELMMDFMDNPAEVAKYIQDVLRSYNLKAQAEYTEKYKIKGILDRGGL